MHGSSSEAPRDFSEECREQLGGNFLDTLIQDVRFSLRTLRRSPAFFLVAVITLALGIGATVAAFSVVNAVLLRPFGFSNSERLLWIYSKRPDNPRTNFSLPEYCDYRDQNTSFEGLAAIASFNPSLSDSGEPERVQGVRLSANVFSILGLRPLIGRTLVAEDDKNGAEPVVLLSYGVWARRYAKNPDVLGRFINVNGESRRIVGVLPSSFALPNLDTDIVVPLQPESDPRAQRAKFRQFSADGRTSETARYRAASACRARFHPPESASAISRHLHRKNWPNDRPDYRRNCHKRPIGFVDDFLRRRRGAVDRLHKSRRDIAVAGRGAPTRACHAHGPGCDAKQARASAVGGKRDPRGDRRFVRAYFGNIGAGGVASAYAN